MATNNNKISLVTTVLNDREGCIAFFSQMERQTYLPNEIVIVDGGSTDGTWEFLQSYKPQSSYSLKVLQEIGCNVARGRNLAIEQANHETIASTDIGCLWETQWLEELVEPLEDSQVDAVMGSWKVRLEDLQGKWPQVEYAILNEPQLLANSKSHASSRSIAYRKALWQKIGGYPEDLTLAGDDMVFALLLHKVTNQVAAAPIPRCYWERPQSLQAFCKEARRNFRGASEAGIWLNYGILVGGRLSLEAFLLLIGIVVGVLSLPIWVVALLVWFPLASFCLRLFRLGPAIQRYNSFGHRDGLLRVVIFEYSTKFWALVGFWERLAYGAKYCQNCRLRLKTSYRTLATQ